MSAFVAGLSAVNIQKLKVASRIMEEGKEESKGLHVNVDEYLGHVGEFGKRQIILQVLFCLMIIPATYQTLLLTFVANNPSWRCTGLNTECNETNSVFTPSDTFYHRRCEMVNRSSWEFIHPKKFSIVTEVCVFLVCLSA